METVGALVSLLAVGLFVIFLAGTVLGRVTFFKIKTRGKAFLGLLGSCVLFIVGGGIAAEYGKPSTPASVVVPPPKSASLAPTPPHPPNTPSPMPPALGKPTSPSALPSAPPPIADYQKPREAEEREQQERKATAAFPTVEKKAKRAKHPAEAIAALQKFEAEFPLSSFAARAAALRKEFETQAEKDEKAHIDAMAKPAFVTAEKKAKRAASPGEAIEIMQVFEAEHPKSSYATPSATMRAEFEKQRAREDQERNAMATLGLEIRDFRSYWTVDPNMLGGEAVVVPFFRFKVKNLLTTPITDLDFFASFELTEKKEQLGTGTSDSVITENNPLKPGYSKEVFFGSGTGYSGLGALSNRPAVDSDLYVEVNGGKRTLIKHVRIANTLR